MEFQFLIGRIKSSLVKFWKVGLSSFQFLIGRIKSNAAAGPVCILNSFNSL